jgi:hypothetical protein
MKDDNSLEDDCSFVQIKYKYEEVKDVSSLLDATL